MSARQRVKGYFKENDICQHDRSRAFLLYYGRSCLDIFACPRKDEQDQTRLNGSLLGAAQLVSSGRPPLINDDSRFVLPGRGSTAPVRTWPGLHIRRKWRVSSPNEEP